MKTTLITLLLIFIFSSINSQEALDKKYRSSFCLSLGQNSLKMKTNYLLCYEKPTVTSIGYGLDIHLSQRIGFSTGIDVDYYKINYDENENDKYNLMYYYAHVYGHNSEYKSTYVYTAGEIDNVDGEDYFTILASRTQKIVNLSIPIHFLYTSNFIRYLRFYGKLGLRNNINIVNRSIDVVERGDVSYIYGADGPYEIKFKSKDLSKIHSSLSLSTGMEWNFSGSKSLKIEVEFNRNLTPIYKQNQGNGFMYKSSNSPFTSSYTYTGLPEDQADVIINRISINQFRFKLFYIF